MAGAQLPMTMKLKMKQEIVCEDTNNGWRAIANNNEIKNYELKMIKMIVCEDTNNGWC